MPIEHKDESKCSDFSSVGVKSHRHDIHERIGTATINSHEDRMSRSTSAEKPNIGITFQGGDGLKSTAHDNDPNNNEIITKDDHRDKRYPNDSYSFLALNGPTIKGASYHWNHQKIKFFLFGLMSFLLQRILFGMLVSNLDSDLKVGKGRQEYDDYPGPDVIVCRILSILTYMVFPNSAQIDILNAVQIYPLVSAIAEEGQKATASVPVGFIRVSCILRVMQANMAIAAFFLVTLFGNSTVEIILNHTAVNFISSLGRLAFVNACTGVFGPSFSKEARRIANADLPSCNHRQPSSVSYRAIVMFYTMLLGAVAITMIMTDESKSFWVSIIYYGPQWLGHYYLLMIMAHFIFESRWKRTSYREPHQHLLSATTKGLSIGL